MAPRRGKKVAETAVTVAESEQIVVEAVVHAESNDKTPTKEQKKIKNVAAGKANKKNVAASADDENESPKDIKKAKGRPKKETTPVEQIEPANGVQETNGVEKKSLGKKADAKPPANDDNENDKHVANDAETNSKKRKAKDAKETKQPSPVPAKVTKNKKAVKAESVESPVADDEKKENVKIAKKTGKKLAPLPIAVAKVNKKPKAKAKAKPKATKGKAKALSSDEEEHDDDDDEEEANIEPEIEAPVEPKNKKASAKQPSKKAAENEKPTASEPVAKFKKETAAKAKKPTKRTAKAPSDEDESIEEANIEPEAPVEPKGKKTPKSESKKATENGEATTSKGRKRAQEKSEEVAVSPKVPKVAAAAAAPRKRGAPIEKPAEPAPVNAELVTVRKRGAKKAATVDDAEPKAKKNVTETNYASINFNIDKEYSMKICSWNVAGLRALTKKNGFDYFEHEKPDIICLQVCFFFYFIYSFHTNENLCFIRLKSNALFNLFNVGNQMFGHRSA